jgi:hypothetical protein
LRLLLRIGDQVAGGIVVQSAVKVQPVEPDAVVADPEHADAGADVAVEDGAAHAAIVSGSGGAKDAGGEVGHG